MKSSLDSPKQQREIAIFWDYENVPLPSWCNTTVAAKAIVDAVSQYGRIVDRRLYYDFDKMNRYRPRDCSSLDSSGFDLVNTPTRNMKETLDKKLIADVLTFAWDSAVRNDHCKPCVVLLTGDGDYAYTLNKLRDRGIMTIVMVGKGCTVASILVDTADVALSLEDDVLRGRESPNATPSKTPRKRLTSMSSFSSSMSGNDGTNDIESLCHYVEEACVTSEDGWVDYGQVSCKLQKTIRLQSPDGSEQDIKEKAKAVRNDAEKKGLIEIGRRKLGKTFDGKREITTSNNPNLNLSNELYVRLIPKGSQADDVMLSLCRYVQEASGTSGDGWVDYGQVSAKLQKKIRLQSNVMASAESIKDKAKAARLDAVKEGLIQIGRRNLDKAVDGKREIVSSVNSTLNLSPESYVRLLPKGEQLIQNDPRGFKTPPKSPPDENINKAATSVGRFAAVFMRGLPQDTSVCDLVEYLEESYHVTVRRALLESSKNPNASTCNGHIEFFDGADVTKVLQKANKANGGQGVSFGGRYIGVTHNTRAHALTAQGNDIVYYESKSLSRMPASESPVNICDELIENDTSNDASVFCHSVYLATQKGSQQASTDRWINSGAIGYSFRSLLSPGYLKTATKEDINNRFRNARNNSVEGGLIEMGRRQIQSTEGDSTYVAVSLFSTSQKLCGNLSPELYLRLLPPGQNLAVKQQSKIQSTASPKTNEYIDHERRPARYVFLNNLPLSTKATHLAEFLGATLECPIQRIELENNMWKGIASIAAHVEFVNAEDANKLIQKAKGYPVGGLVYCGRNIYAIPDRITPDTVDNDETLNPDMSYTREMGEQSSTSDTSVPEPLVSSLETIETHLLIDTNHVMSMSDTSFQKDPFEDLLWS